MKEIADWIQQHPKDAAEMNSNIASLSAATGSLSTNIEAVAGNVTSLSGATVNGFADRYTKAEVNAEVANAVASGKAAADKALEDAKAYTDTEVESAVTVVREEIEGVAGNVTSLSAATVAGLNDRYTKKEVNDHLANAVASGKAAADKALEDAKAYTDTEVESAVTVVREEIEGVAGNVTSLSAATVAGLNDRYTKKEVNDHLANAVASGKAAADKALEDAKAYTDTEVESAVTVVREEIEGVAGNVTSLSAATVALAASAVTSFNIIGTEDAENKQTVTATITNNVAEFNFSNMVIDCGTF